MTRNEMRELEEAEVEAALRREVAEAQIWNESQRPTPAYRAVRSSGISQSGAAVESAAREVLVPTN